MATTSYGQPILAAVPPPPINLKTPYATILNSKNKDKDTTVYETFDVPIKPPKNINGRHTISWSKKEIQQSILQTNLQYAIMGKFKHGNIDIHELRKEIPSQCGIKGECIIGLLETRVILIRCIDRVDYINLLSTTGFWLKLKNESVHMRTLKWDIWQDVKKEPPIAMAWISLPNLPPNFFAEDFVKSIALAVGKPMQVDLATKTNSRPSCARVKVEVNLLGDLPEVVEVGEHDEDENVIFSKWIKIRYDYLPKYCKTCCLQGHDEQECYSLHPQLYPRKNMEDKQKNVGVGNQKHSENKEDNLVIDNGKNPVQTTKGNTIVTTTEPHNIFSNGRLVFNNQPHEEWQQGRKKKHGVSHSLDQTVQVWKTNDSKEDKEAGLHRLSNVNTFTVLNNEEDEHIQEMDKERGEVRLLRASENAMQDNNDTVVGTMNQIQTVDDVDERDEEGLLDEMLKTRGHHQQKERDEAHDADMRNDSGQQKKVMENDSGGNKSSDGPRCIKNKKYDNSAPHAPTLKSDKHMQAHQRLGSREGVGEVTVGFLECIDNTHQNSNKVAENAQCGVQQLLNSSKKKESCKELVNTSFQKMGQQSTMATTIDAVNNITSNEGNLVSKDRTNAAQADIMHSAEMSTRQISTNPRANEAQTGGQGAGEMNVERVPLNTECYSIPSESPQELTRKDQSDEHDPQAGGSSMQTSPSHSSNVLVPPQDLEVIFKLDRLLKLHGTNNIITMEMAKKMSKEELQIIVKRDEDRTLSPILTYIRKGLIAPPEELTQKKATEPTKPMRVQPTRSSKSNSTRGK